MDGWIDSTLVFMFAWSCFKCVSESDILPKAYCEPRCLLAGCWAALLKCGKSVLFYFILSKRNGDILSECNPCVCGCFACRLSENVSSALQDSADHQLPGPLHLCGGAISSLHPLPVLKASTEIVRKHSYVRCMPSQSSRGSGTFFSYFLDSLS